MATATGLILTKRFTYRGNPDEEWSNKYWLTGTPPSTEQHWLDLVADLGGKESLCYAPTSKLVSAMGYNDTDPHAHNVFMADLVALSLTVTGALVVDAGEFMAGDQAGIVQWQIARKTKNGKPIRLRKFFHDGGTSLTDHDAIGSSTYSAYSNFATELVNGSVLGSRVIRSQLQDESITFVGAYPYVTTRTLKKRGKRPLPKA